MSNCPFCNLEPEPDSGRPKPTESTLGDGQPPKRFLRRAWHGIQWLFPAALLVLLPKCPLCVAAYVALFTGIGISVSTARWIQVLMLALCLAALAYLGVRYRRRRLRAPAYPGATKSLRWEPMFLKPLAGKRAV